MRSLSKTNLELIISTFLVLTIGNCAHGQRSAQVVVPLLDTQSETEREAVFEEGDWVSFSDFRVINSVDIGLKYVYAATQNGIERYDNFRYRYADPLTSSDGLPDNFVLDLKVDPVTSNLWCLTRQGIGIYLEGIRRWERLDTVPGTATDIVIAENDHGADIFVRASGAWFLFSRNNDQFYRVERSDVPSLDGGDRRSRVNRRVLSDPKLAFLNPYFVQDEHLRMFQFTEIVEDKFSHYVYVGTDGANMYRYSKLYQDGEQLPFGLVEKNVTAMAIDGKDIWFGGGRTFAGASSQGISIAKDDLRDWKYFEPQFIREIKNADINEILVDKDHIWFATNLGVLQYKNKRSWKSLTASKNNLPGDEVYTIAELGDTLWMGGRAGLAKMSKKTLEATKVTFGGLRLPEVYKLFVDGPHLYVGCDYGLYRFDSKNKKWELIWGSRGFLLGYRIADMAKMGEKILIATNHGVKMFDTKNNSMVGYLGEDIRVDRPVTSLAVDSSNVWIGEWSGVSQVSRKTGSSHFYSEGPYGLIASPVNDIVIDGDYVWFATPEGATRFFWNSPRRGG